MKMNSRTESIIYGLIVAMALLPRLCDAQTPIDGPYIHTSTWSPSGSPYIVGSDCTVPCGEKLTIQPGVEVWIDSGVSITVSGEIQAMGTPQQRIIIRAPSASLFWNSLILYPCDYSKTNRLRFCSFQNATNAVTIWDPIPGTMATEIQGCSFSNCVSRAISVWVGGNVTQIQVIKNCEFNNTGDGCVIDLHQTGGGTAYDNLTVVGNIFRNLTGAALRLENTSGGGYSPALLQNNVIANCQAGIVVSDSWDATVQSCVFIGCTNAVMASGVQSRAVGYNDFYGNATNFTGYSSNYGTPSIQNRNGTPCDAHFNIFQNPNFVSATDFHLQTNSPCIDAGIGTPAYFDSYFPPSLGSVTNDIGAYGGPDAGQWLVPPSTNLFYLSAARYVGVTIYPPKNGHYRLEYASKLAGINTWIQLTNMDLSAPFTYVEPAQAPERHYRAVLQ